MALSCPVFFDRQIVELVNPTKTLLEEIYIPRGPLKWNEKNRPFWKQKQCLKSSLLFLHICAASDKRNLGNLEDIFIFKF